MGREQDKVYETLRQRLIGGVYEPGSQLREEPLAKEFGVSRTPVRAALRRLVEDGLACDDAGQGIHVAQWSEHDIEDTFRLRMLLEPYATRLACERGSDELLTALRRANDAMAAASKRGQQPDVTGVQTANRDFHRALLDHCGSARLRSILETMIEMPIIMRSFDLASTRELKQSLQHHEDIIKAAELRDGELGLRAMQLHLRMSYSRFMRHRGQWKSKK